ncbi:MAG: bifunctional folylpolyglutamate synthase/dihydrofolate synthase, partial [Bacillota bacterium]
MSGLSVHYLQTLRRFGEKPGLARIRFLLERLGNPQRAYPAVHVAGTNGKGSTSAMIASVLQAAGYRTGLFTSPHLVRYNERIRVDGAPIADEDLEALLGRLREEAERAAADPNVGQPTEFEVGTAAALTYFAQAAVDVAAVEVGLGG